ncbi:PilT protein domain protein [Desulfamplus magnetovallimortis]|uniref:PilT protein domain protein n=1 Tax=Desulfamplus magnetovallimortis TaxID=1246637 RepID=A0A1W1HIR4_9BACT|nr:type II toxin-antitoxin system VapC family toxin [Desulfamplus magnetovallimortis]SLM32369.1 PilT protein domain protein [Desulfamplus magnetovallimortis]
MLYIDTNILAAYYCPESLSDKIEEILINTEEPAVSQLTEIELASAISRKIRENSLSKEDGDIILSLFQTHIDQKSFIYLPIQTKHYSIAKKWIAQFNTPLRSLDAIHLAIAHEKSIPILTADAKLANSAKILGVDAILVL